MVPELDVTKAQVDKQGEVYTLRLPWSGEDVAVNLASMRDIESYSPFRILDVCVRGGEGACMVIKVATENKPVAVSSVDIVRIKRKCVSSF